MKVNTRQLTQIADFLTKHNIDDLDMVNSFDGLHLKFQSTDPNDRGHYDIKLTAKGAKISQYTKEEDL